VNLWYQWSGKRGEFDRRSYSDYCMKAWREVFFAETGTMDTAIQYRARRSAVVPSGRA
jgi:hypothetical protein